MLYSNPYNPDTKNGRKRLYERAYRFYNKLPAKGEQIGIFRELF